MNEVQILIFDGRVPSDIAADYILPDTYPDVKKILRIRARPILIGRYAAAGRLEFTGAVDYIVTFSADNGDGKPDSLHAVHFAGEYAGAVDLSSDMADCEISMTSRILQCDARLPNPRKLSIHSQVGTDIQIARLTDVSPKLICGTSAETLTETLPSLRECHFLADHQQISENIEPDASWPAIDEIITCEAELHFHEVKPQRGTDGLSLLIKGEAIVDCLYKAQTEPGDYRSFCRKIPLSLSVSVANDTTYFDGVETEALSATANGILTEINATVSDNSYGERRVLELDVSFDIAVCLMANRDAVLTLDAYSTERDTDIEAEGMSIRSLTKVVNANFSVNESVACDAAGLTQKDGTACNIVDTAIDVNMKNIHGNGNRTQLTGEAEVSCVLSDRGSFTVAEFTLPVKCDFNVGDTENVLSECICKASDIRTRFDGNRINCDFEISLTASLICRKQKKRVACITFASEPREKKEQSAAIVLCYPSKGETLWQIAKRYNTTTAVLSANNTVTPMPSVLIIDNV